MAVLEIDSVLKSFRGKSILSDVWIKVETGEIVGLLGRNGSGKSTLLKIISGNLSADQSHLKITGKFVSGTKRSIAYLSQDNFIPRYFSVEKAVKLSLDNEEIDAFYNDDMMKSIIGQNVGNLSTGQRRYFEIRLLLFHSADFVLLDEPYNGLSPGLVEAVNALIVERSAKNGIIITDHSYRNVLEICTRLVLMKNGKTNHLNDKSELVEKGYLNDEMLDFL